MLPFKGAIHGLKLGSLPVRTFMHTYKASNIASPTSGWINHKINVRPTSRGYATVKTPNIDWNPMKSKHDLNNEGDRTKSHKVVFGLLCFAPILTFCLGVWQVKRLKWKTKLIAQAEDRLSYKPIVFPNGLTDEEVEKELLYRKVYITGKFDYSREVYVGPRLRDGRKGYTVVCPFALSNGDGDILVERGWIGESKVIPESRKLQHLSCPQGTITIECVVKMPHKKTALQMKHDKGARLFEYTDAYAMADELGTRHSYLQAVKSFSDRPEWRQEETLDGDLDKHENVTEKKGIWIALASLVGFGGNSDKKPKLTLSDLQKKQIGELEQDEQSDIEFDEQQFVSAGVPIGQEPRIEYRNNHMQYLITWFSLSFAATVLLYIIVKKKRWVDPRDEKVKYAKRFLR